MNELSETKQKLMAYETERPIEFILSDVCSRFVIFLFCFGGSTDITLAIRNENMCLFPMETKTSLTKIIFLFIKLSSYVFSDETIQRAVM